jgi:voltage-gated potassium channel Kch
LLRFERKIPFREQISSNIDKIDSEIIIICLGRYGGQLAQRLHKEGVRILGVDFDPERVRELRGHGLRVAFGDVESTELAEMLPLAKARWVVSTLPDVGINLALIANLRQHGYSGLIAAVAHTKEDVHTLTQAGASTVFLPYADATEFAAETLYQSLKERDFST